MNLWYMVEYWRWFTSKCIRKLMKKFFRYLCQQKKILKLNHEIFDYVLWIFVRFRVLTFWNEKRLLDYKINLFRFFIFRFKENRGLHIILLFQLDNIFIWRRIRFYRLRLKAFFINSCNKRTFISKILKLMLILLRKIVNFVLLSCFSVNKRMVNLSSKIKHCKNNDNWVLNWIYI